MLARVGYVVTTARDASEALEHVSTQPIDIVLCDVKMPGINGHELVRQIHELEPDLPCIVVTGYSSPESSLEALRAGAYWYLEKPFEQGQLGVIRRLVEQAVEHGRLKAENRLLQSQLRSRYRFDNVVGESPALRRVLDVVDRVARSDSTVLITGESGTGKELVARAIHYNSPRAHRLLVTVNCGAIPEELLESELFGHVRGAFTGALSPREGRFALAHGGTIFLDEIGDMSLNLQIKLLRVLQEKQFEPVGSSKTQTVDVRVIAATNQDLPGLIAEKRFREDLFYRLNVIPIETPALRERSDDIPLLVEHFLKVLREEKGEASKGIAPDAMAALCAYRWPGNVRELENLVERLVILGGESEITLADLPRDFRTGSPAPLDSHRLPPEGLSFNEVISRHERSLIEQALDQTGWNKNRAAQLLDLNRTTLIEKIKKHKLVAPGD